MIVCWSCHARRARIQCKLWRIINRDLNPYDMREKLKSLGYAGFFYVREDILYMSNSADPSNPFLIWKK